jgi:hypothetical protein
MHCQSCSVKFFRGFVSFARNRTTLKHFGGFGSLCDKGLA